MDWVGLKWYVELGEPPGDTLTLVRDLTVATVSEVSDSADSKGSPISSSVLAAPSAGSGVTPATIPIAMITVRRRTKMCSIVEKTSRTAVKGREGECRSWPQPNQTTLSQFAHRFHSVVWYTVVVTRSCLSKNCWLSAR